MYLNLISAVEYRALVHIVYEII